jgi:hypothetical protein
MKLSSTDIQMMSQAIDHHARSVIQLYKSSNIHSGDFVNPELLADALHVFIDLLKRIETDTQEPPLLLIDTTSEQHIAQHDVIECRDLTQVADYGLNLLQELSRWAMKLHLEQARLELDKLLIPVSLWTARHGGHINTLEPVVNILATLANDASSSTELIELCAVMGEIIEAISPEIKQDKDKTNPGRPWRILNLNRGIVATRSHDREVMELAFNQLVRNVPADAAEFFREGKQQMDILDYPEKVRVVMEKYYQLYTNRTVH